MGRPIIPIFIQVGRQDLAEALNAAVEAASVEVEEEREEGPCEMCEHGYHFKCHWCGSSLCRTHAIEHVCEQMKSDPPPTDG